MDPTQLRELIVRPTLKFLKLWNQAVEDLVMGTAAQESGLRYLHQVGGGPALGLWQMEPDTHDDIWTNFLRFRADLAASVMIWCDVSRNTTTSAPTAEHLSYNLRYACAMCRLAYARAPGAIPDDLPGQAAYYKAHYNGPGAATVEQYIANYSKVRA